jgi:heme-degrading monooxygenase HmoA
MYVIIWEYQVKPECVTEFERIYAPNGEWADLFIKGDGYLGTELLHDPNRPLQYISIDRWISSQAHDLFHSRWEVEYNALDKRCENLTDKEAFRGAYTFIPIRS